MSYMTAYVVIFEEGLRVAIAAGSWLPLWTQASSQGRISFSLFLLLHLMDKFVNREVASDGC
jgi:hypothetical protein